ncbi:Imm50 family immunity protein [Streptomyces sp. NPDC055189]
MTWNSFLADQEMLTRLYCDIPPLQEVRLRSVDLDWRGPGATLRIDLPRFPDSPPQEWIGEDLDALQCHLKFLAVDGLSLSNWNPPATVSISITPQAERRVLVEVSGACAHLEFSSSDSLRVDHVSAFRIAPDGTDSGRHLFVRKIDARLHSSVPPTHVRNFYANP